MGHRVGPAHWHRHTSRKTVELIWETHVISVERVAGGKYEPPHTLVWIYTRLELAVKRPRRLISRRENDGTAVSKYRRTKESKMAQAQTQHHSDPVAPAAELRPPLERNAVQAERDRRLSTEDVETLRAANLFKVDRSGAR
jgi:hypothetical protein